MNKKTIAVVMSVVGLILAGGASAALVNYLSNTITATTSIASPVSMSVNAGIDGSVSGNQSVAVSAFGGSDFQFTSVAKNNSTTNSITGYRVLVVTAPNGAPFTGGEVSKVVYQNANHPTTAEAQDITPYLVVVYADGSIHWLKDWTGSSQKLVLITSIDGGNTADQDTLTPNENDWNGFTMTSNVAITPGTYTIQSLFVPDLAKFAATQY